MNERIEQNPASYYLEEMRKSQGVDKGVWGERAIVRILLSLYQERGGILIHSYEYQTDPTKNGNIKNHDGELYLEKLGSATEIDVLYVTQYRVFPIEIKSYLANEIRLTTEGISGCSTTDKSPIHQNEMHCNHLYSAIWEGIEADPSFIVPVVAFSTWENKPMIYDNRPDNERSYIKICNTNTVYDLIKSLDTPNGKRINLDQIDRLLKNKMISSDAYYPVSWR